MMGQTEKKRFRSYRPYVAQLYQRTLGRHESVPLPNSFAWVVRNMYPEDDVSMYIGFQNNPGSNKTLTI